MQFGFTEAADVNISSVKGLLTEHYDLALTARERGGDANGTCPHLLWTTLLLVPTLCAHSQGNR